MDGIQNKELSVLRAAASALMRDACNILQATTTSDGRGGTPQVWGTLVAGVPCRLDHKVGSEYAAAAGRKSAEGFMLTVPFDTEIYENYRVEVGGVTFAVVTTNNSQTDLIVKRLEVERV